MLEGAKGEEQSESITADKLAKILESVNQLQTGRNHQESNERQAKRLETHWSEDHEQVLGVINATEKSCGATFARIQKQLAEVKELSRSNLALKRLIKRNAKREAKLGRFLVRGKLPSELTGSSSEFRGKHCKLPFVVADYTPERQDGKKMAEG